MKAAGAANAGTMKGKVKRDPGAAGKIGKGQDKAQGRAMRAAKNYQKAASAMGKGAMNKRTDVSLATAGRALDVYRGKPVTGKRMGLTSGAKPKAIGKAAAAKPAKPTRKPLDAAKVERIIRRAGSNVDRPGKFNRVTAVKSANFRETRSRALDYLNKAAGLQVKKKGGRAENPKGLTREQMLANIGSNNPTRRSTLKNRSKDVARRSDKRKATAGLFGKDAPKGTYADGRDPAKPARKGSLRALPRRAAEAKGTPQFYSNGDVNQKGMAGFNQHGHKPRTRGRFQENRSDVFGGRTSIRNKPAAARAYRRKVVAVGKLAGTARKGGATSRIKRGKATQRTLTGGRATTYGRPRFARR